MITTRDRLLDAGIALIAERGFKATTVGDIEEAVGLVPRSGALYKHFESKTALVEAALQDRIDQVRSLAALTSEFRPTSDAHGRRATLLFVGQQVFNELDREALIARILEKEGDRFPVLRDRMHDEMVQPGYDFAELALRHWVETYDGPDDVAHRLTQLDMPAIAAVVLGALVNHRRHQWMFGRLPHEIDDDRFLQTWADMTLLLFAESAPTNNSPQETK